jgi:hypothetical protein
MLPEHLEALALRVVVETRHRDEGRLARLRRRLHVLDEVLALANPDDLPGGRGGWKKLVCHGIPRSAAPPSTKPRRNADATREVTIASVGGTRRKP